MLLCKRLQICTERHDTYELMVALRPFASDFQTRYMLRAVSTIVKVVASTILNAPLTVRPSLSSAYVHSSHIAGINSCLLCRPTNARLSTKEVNAYLGEAIALDVLQEIADRLAQCVGQHLRSDT